MACQLPIPDDRIAAFCTKWAVRELALFGSVLRADFSPASDVDVLVAFDAGFKPTLQQWLEMTDELHAIFGRELDLVERRRVTNPFRRYEIITTRKVVYAA